MAEPTEKTTETNPDKTDIPPQTQTPSETKPENDGWDATKYKQYQKTLPKRFWGNEKLQKYDSIGDFLDESLKEKAKKAPETYTLSNTFENNDKLTKLYKDYDLDEKEANALNDVVATLIPKKVDRDAVLKTLYGDKFDASIALSQKGSTPFMDDDMKKMAKDYKLMDNPAFIEFAKKVGEKMGDSTRTFDRTNVPPKTETKDPYQLIADKLLNIKE